MVHPRLEISLPVRFFAILILKSGRIWPMEVQRSRSLLLLVAVVYLFSPVFEIVDHWDRFPQNDFVLTLVVMEVCFALVSAMARHGRAPSSKICPSSSATARQARPGTPAAKPSGLLSSETPPVVLRI